VSGPAARAWRFAGALCGLVVLIDQATKAIVEANLVPRERVDVIGPLELTSSHNTGVAFGLAGGSGLGVTLLTLAALGLILALFARDPERPGAWVATGLLAGGALGNLADRLRVDAVTDFIDLSAWPPFNVADIAITFGVAILAWSFLREAQ
jgi:signal peptidase II